MAVTSCAAPSDARASSSLTRVRPSFVRLLSSVSVYRLHDHEMKLWSHGSLGNGALRRTGWSCAAAWYDDTTVVVSDSTGGVQFLLQDFDL